MKETDKRNQLLDRARTLRRNMTRQEKHLWYDYLRHYPIKIYKQRIIDNFIADFYCHAAKLILEIDGAQHYEPNNKRYDDFRTEKLQEYYLTVIRFTNQQIDKNFEGVCSFIDKTVQNMINPG